MSGERVNDAARLARWADAGLLAIAIVWGGTFPIVKDLVERVPPHALVAVRFGVAWLLLAGWAWRRRAAWRPDLVKAGVLLGLILWGGFFTQTVGLEYTGAAKAGFITALNVVLVPVLAWIAFGQRVSWMMWIGVATAAAGLALLAVDWRAGFWVEPGDLFVTACAALFAAHIVTVSRLSPRFDSVLLGWVQIGTVAVVSGIGAWLLDGGFPGVARPDSVLPLLYLSVLATAGALVGQVYLQKFTAPARVGLILALEPVFAALFAWLFLGERLVATGWLGGALVLAGVAIAELERSAGKPAAGGEIRGRRIRRSRCLDVGR
ncbi:MAG: DMT family transporter [Firmicutes bacterium]|nr:DMT family transporter [Bacillota bacterium]